jgi:tetratricopeptide (TPR) repeat protein
LRSARRNIGILLSLATGLALFSGCQDEPIPLSTDSAGAYELYLQGMDEMRRFQHELAAQTLEKAVAEDPEFALAHLELSTALEMTGHEEEAKRSLQRAYELRENGTERERLQIEHTHARRLGKLEESIARYEELLAAYPDDPYTLEIRAGRAYRSGQHEVAADLYGRILQLDPSRVDMHNMLGYVALSTGDYEEAIGHFRRYVYYAQGQANPHDSLAEAYFYLAQYDDSIREYEAALEIDPTFLHPAAMLARVYAHTGQLRRARKLLENHTPMFERYGEQKWLQKIQIEIDYLAQDWQAMADRLEGSLVSLDELEAKGYTDPDSDMPYASRIEKLADGLGVQIEYACALLRAGDVERGRKAAQDAKRWMDGAEAFMAADPLHAELPDWLRLARGSLESSLARAEHRPADAVTALAAAIDMSKQSPHELVNLRLELARAALDAGDYDRAQAAARRVLDDIPRQPRAQLTAALAAAGLGRADEALQYLGLYADTMINAESDHPEVREARALMQQFSVAN